MQNPTYKDLGKPEQPIYRVSRQVAQDSRHTATGSDPSQALVWKVVGREAGGEGKDASFTDATVWEQKQGQEAGGHVEHLRTEGAVPTSMPFFFFSFKDFVVVGYFFNFLFCIGVQPINNVAVISGEHQRDSAIHIHISILCKLPSHPGFQIRLSRDPCALKQV